MSLLLFEVWWTGTAGCHRSVERCIWGHPKPSCLQIPQRQMYCIEDMEIGKIQSVRIWWIRDFSWWRAHIERILVIHGWDSEIWNGTFGVLAQLGSFQPQSALRTLIPPSRINKRARLISERDIPGDLFLCLDIVGPWHSSKHGKMMIAVKSSRRKFIALRGTKT